MTGIVAIQHHKLPFAKLMRAANMKWRALEFVAHRLGFVMIAGDAEHRLGEIAEDAAKPQITGFIVLHQITGHQHRLIIWNSRERIGERRMQAWIGLNAAQAAACAAVQMGVGDLYDSHRQMLAKHVSRDGELGHGHGAGQTH
jgi:hypothetical protein